MSHILFFLLILTTKTLILTSVSAKTEFVYNRNFNSTNVKLIGHATMQSSILTITNQTFFSIGRAFYPYKIPMKNAKSSAPLPFATSFIFSIAPYKNFPIAHGFAFMISPTMAINGALTGNYLGLFNRSTAGKKKPHRPLISKPINLSGVLLDEMYVGFSGSTGKMIDVCRILAWSYSNSNFSIGDALKTKHLPLFVHPKASILRSKGFTIGVVFGALFITGCCCLVFLSLFRTRREEKEEKIEDWELEYWPHRINYQEICDATSGFSEEKVIGIGTSGKVYKGVLRGVEVAVKSISHETQHGMREFLAEISSLGRMKHRNLVGFRGWSKRKGGKLILVYDYMSNGSLDKRIFECEETNMLTWEERLRVLRNVACGILYLHEGWDVEVLHRDIKSSNVLLDNDMNARLGDFGLARLHHQGHVADPTRVIGTLGYMAPELVRVGRPSTATDMYSFGILMLEVVCGRRPIVADKPPLIDWVFSLVEKEELSCANDERLNGRSGFNSEEAKKVLQLGLLCASSEPGDRPTMRQVVKVLDEIKCNECNEECIHASLLGKINSAASWSKRSANSPHTHYPTFDEICQTSFYSTMSSVSYPSPRPEPDFISEGR
ncbi:unnamed protein product [Lupinus luteus]|uniref:non-specific serine/threonine protein kinase n=1 Tax=Lupinus luteus TaxID=3873 RepID=A0AAV1XN61_LUPLU